MLGDEKKEVGPSVVLGRGCKDLCLDSPEERERRKRRKHKNNMEYINEEKCQYII